MTATDYDFALLVDYSREELLRELALVASELANLHEEIAFNRMSERDNPNLKFQRYNDEGHRSALNEKKQLLGRLLDGVK